MAANVINVVNVFDLETLKAHLVKGNDFARIVNTYHQEKVREKTFAPDGWDIPEGPLAGPIRTENVEVLEGEVEALRAEINRLKFKMREEKTESKQKSKTNRYEDRKEIEKRDRAIEL
jgi:predicted RNase H-like nuclease (RuvC/YqgF family)